MKFVRQQPTQRTSDIILLAGSKGTGEIFDDLRVEFRSVDVEISRIEDYGIEVNGRLIQMRFSLL